MTPEQLAAERAAFEKWFVSVEGSRVVSRGMLEQVQAGPFAGDYRDGLTQGAWNVWLARAEQAHADQVALLRRLRKVARKHSDIYDVFVEIDAELTKLEGKT